MTGHRTRWYTTKTEPSYEVITIKLRRVIIAARFRSQRPEQQPHKKPGPSSPPGQPAGLDPQICETRGVWVAGVVERCLKWPLTHAEEMQEAVMQREESLDRMARADPRDADWRRRSGLARRQHPNGIGVVAVVVPESERTLK